MTCAASRYRWLAQSPSASGSSVYTCGLRWLDGAFVPDRYVTENVRLALLSDLRGNPTAVVLSGCRRLAAA